MCQRVGIAAALACNPALLIADEPTTAMDVTIQPQILELMKELLAKHESSLLMITYNLGQKVAVMCAGSIVEFGTVEEVFLSPRHQYTVGLFASSQSWRGPGNGWRRFRELLPMRSTYRRIALFILVAAPVGSAAKRIGLP